MVYMYVCMCNQHYRPPLTISHVEDVGTGTNCTWKTWGLGQATYIVCIGTTYFQVLTSFTAAAIVGRRIDKEYFVMHMFAQLHDHQS